MLSFNLFTSNEKDANKYITKQLQKLNYWCLFKKNVSQFNTKKTMKKKPVKSLLSNYSEQ